jgi:hypothetical protein
MAGQTSISFLGSLLRVVVRDLKQKSKDSLFHLAGSLFGVLFGRTIGIALGPVGLALPVDKLVAWAARMAYEGWRDMTGALYELRPTTSGLLMARRAPILARRAPLILPESARFSLEELLAPGPQIIRQADLTRTESARIFRRFSVESNGLHCVLCGRPLGGEHDPTCAFFRGKRFRTQTATTTRWDEEERQKRIKAGGAFTLVQRNLPPAFRK